MRCSLDVNLVILAGVGVLAKLPAVEAGSGRCSGRWAQNRASDTVFVNSTSGVDVPGCGTSRGKPCKTISFSIAQAPKDGTICVAEGTYTSWNGSETSDPQFLVNKSLSVIAEHGATVDCLGNASAMDLLVSSGMRVEVDGLTFHNCSGVNRTNEADTYGMARRPWGIGGAQQWCRDNENNFQSGCSCALMYCSRAGGVSIIHQDYEQFDDWAQKPEVLTPVVDVHVTFHRCTWTSNSAHLGGGVQLMMVVNFTNSSFTFNECRFEKNFLLRENGNPTVYSSFSHGSAFFQQLDVSYNYAEKKDRIPKLPSLGTALENTSIVFDQCHVASNTNQADGTVAFSDTPGFWDGVLIELNNMTIINNTVNGNGGGIEMYGGVPLKIDGPNNTIRVQRCNISHNKNIVGVGGAALLGTFAYATLRTPQITLPSNEFRDFRFKIIVEVVDTLFANNEAFVAGAYATGNGYHIMHGVQFINNHAKQQAGALVNSLGGGDSGMEFYDCLFENNSAGHLTHTLFDGGAGPFFAENTTFKLHGTANGVEDINLDGVGVGHILQNTTFVCPNGYVLQNPTGPDGERGGFTLGTTGVLQASWNQYGVGVSVNFLMVMCNLCPPGRYMLNVARLQGPFYSARTGPGADANQSFGNISGQISQNLDDACTPCPVAADCSGGNLVTASQRQVFGYACDARGLCSAYDSAGSIERRQVHFSRCAKGFCKSKGMPAWNETCLPHRQGNLCGSCQIGFSESWLGSFPCVRDELCTSLPWLLPLLLIALFAFGFYIYISARKAMYTSLDAAFLFFQMFLLVSGSSSLIDAVAPLIGLLGLSLDAGSSDDGGLVASVACMAPGLTAYDKLFLRLLPPLLMPLMVLFVHCLIQRCSCLASLFDFGSVAIAPLTAAMLKTFFYCFSSLSTALFKISHCVEGDGQDRRYHWYAGDVACEHVVSLNFLSVVCVLLPSVFCILVQLSKSVSWLFDNVLVFRKMRPVFMEILNREVASGIKESMWWWAFALAMVRGILALFVAVINDAASQCFLSFLLCATMFGISLGHGPFEEPVRNKHQAFLFFLLVLTSGFSIGRGVVVQAGSGIIDEARSLASYLLLGHIDSIISLCAGGGCVVWAILHDDRHREQIFLQLLRVSACCQRCCKCRKRGVTPGSAQLLQHVSQDHEQHNNANWTEALRIDCNMEEPRDSPIFSR